MIRAYERTQPLLVEQARGIGLAPSRRFKVSKPHTDLGWIKCPTLPTASLLYIRVPRAADESMVKLNSQPPGRKWGGGGAPRSWVPSPGSLLANNGASDAGRSVDGILGMYRRRKPGMSWPDSATKKGAACCPGDPSRALSVAARVVERTVSSLLGASSLTNLLHTTSTCIPCTLFQGRPVVCLLAASISALGRKFCTRASVHHPPLPHPTRRPAG